MNNAEFFYTVAQMCQHEHSDVIHWRGDDIHVPTGELRIYVDVTDTFYRNRSQEVQILPTDLPMLQQAYADIGKITGDPIGNAHLAFYLFAARKLGTRPQDLIYRYLNVRIWDDNSTDTTGKLNQIRTDMLHALFDEAGPERPHDADNPHDRNANLVYSPARKAPHHDR